VEFKYLGHAVSLCDKTAVIAGMLRDTTNDAQYITEYDVWFVIVCNCLVICWFRNMVT
jgi:hypothetical protein